MEQDAEDDNSLLRASGEQALSASNGGLISPQLPQGIGRGSNILANDESAFNDQERSDRNVSSPAKSFKSSKTNGNVTKNLLNRGLDNMDRGQDSDPQGLTEIMIQPFLKNEYQLCENKKHPHEKPIHIKYS